MKPSPFYLKAQAVPRSKHLPPRLKKPVVEGCIGKHSMFSLRHVQKVQICVSLLYVCVAYVCVCRCCMCVSLLYVCVAGFTVDVELLAKSQYSEGPATGHLDTVFSWFPYVCKQMPRWLPTFQVATTCFSCSPYDLNLNLSLTSFIFFFTCEVTTATGRQPNCS